MSAHWLTHLTPSLCDSCYEGYIILCETPLGEWLHAHYFWIGSCYHMTSACCSSKRPYSSRADPWSNRSMAQRRWRLSDPSRRSQAWVTPLVVSSWCSWHLSCYHSISRAPYGFPGVSSSGSERPGSSLRYSCHGSPSSAASARSSDSLYHWLSSSKALDHWAVEGMTLPLSDCTYLCSLETGGWFCGGSFDLIWICRRAGSGLFWLMGRSENSWWWRSSCRYLKTRCYVMCLFLRCKQT